MTVWSRLSWDLFLYGFRQTASFVRHITALKGRKMVLQEEKNKRMLKTYKNSRGDEFKIIEYINNKKISRGLYKLYKMFIYNIANSL